MFNLEVVHLNLIIYSMLHIINMNQNLNFPPSYILISMAYTLKNVLECLCDPKKMYTSEHSECTQLEV